jgi:hypothetical protein
MIARREITTRLGCPVDPEVSMTTGSGSAPAASQASTSATVGEKSTRRTY